ncbi:MAG: ribosomal L29 protein-domain-containing protein [Piptocephalis tieghemiana]|nr:MAG: ribosomal L29 protein-domain-containing protein [Piptocephalis tieghemiana]
MVIVKAHELRNLPKAELEKQLVELKTELAELRAKSASGGSAKVYKIQQLRKSIARVLTVITQTQRDQLRLFYKGSKAKPLDLRTKRTRAIRRRLSATDAARKTERQIKKNIHFPARKYAVKA